MPYEWISASDESPESLPNAPEFGDEAEYDYIVEQGQLEAEQFSGADWPTMSPRPAKWLNPPRRVPDGN